jgi:cation:H+ antiporter
VGLFLFWQCFHVFEVLKSNVRQNKSLSWMLAWEIALLGAGAYAQYISIDWLVHWLSRQPAGFVSARNLGWLSGWLMVLPNGILAWYYAWRRNPEIVYTSQVGDAHVCIPLCIGVFALFRTCPVPPVFQSGMILLIAATLAHMVFIGALGRLPRWAGALMLGAYAVFLWGGLGGGR